jgi:hypothetical protein
LEAATHRDELKRGVDPLEKRQQAEQQTANSKQQSNKLQTKLLRPLLLPTSQPTKTGGRTQSTGNRGPIRWTNTFIR